MIARQACCLLYTVVEQQQFQLQLVKITPKPPASYYLSSSMQKSRFCRASWHPRRLSEVFRQVVGQMLLASFGTPYVRVCRSYHYVY